MAEYTTQEFTNESEAMDAVANNPGATYEVLTGTTPVENHTAPGDVDQPHPDAQLVLTGEYEDGEYVPTGEYEEGEWVPTGENHPGTHVPTGEYEDGEYVPTGEYKDGDPVWRGPTDDDGNPIETPPESTSITLVGNIGRNNANNDWNGSQPLTLSPGVVLSGGGNAPLTLTVSANAAPGTITIIFRATGDVFDVVVNGAGSFGFGPQSSSNGFQIGTFTLWGEWVDGEPVPVTEYVPGEAITEYVPGAPITTYVPGAPIMEFEQGAPIMQWQWQTGGEEFTVWIVTIPVITDPIDPPEDPIVPTEPVDPTDPTDPTGPTPEETPEPVVAAATDPLPPTDPPTDGGETEEVVDITPMPVPLDAPQDLETIVMQPQDVPLAPPPVAEVAGFITTGLILASLIAAVVGNSIRKMRAEEEPEEAEEETAKA